MIGIISILLLVMWALFIYGIHIDQEYFIYIAASGLILMSVYIMVNGLEGTNNWVTIGLSVIQIGIGFMGIFAPLFSGIVSDAEETSSESSEEEE